MAPLPLHTAKAPAHAGPLEPGPSLPPSPSPTTQAGPPTLRMLFCSIIDLGPPPRPQAYLFSASLSPLTLQEHIDRKNTTMNDRQAYITFI
jgi:hypothetical protein